MYSEIAQKKIDYAIKWANEIKSEVYNFADVYDKLQNVDTFNSSISMCLSSVDIYYSLLEDEDLLYTANQLLENIDIALDFKRINVDKADYLTGMSLFRFQCTTKTKVRVEITVNFSASKNCNLEYEDVTTKKAVLKCA